MPAAVHPGSHSRHGCITQQMENIMMLMMSERGKKGRHRRAKGRARVNAHSPERQTVESSGALVLCYFTSLSNKISAECFHFADGTDVSAGFTGGALPPSPQIWQRLCITTGKSVTLMSPKPEETQENLAPFLG